MIDVLKQYDDWAANGGLPTVDAAASGTPVAGLASSTDTSDALADGSNLWTDLLSTLDGTGAAADSTNFPSELASLY